MSDVLVLICKICRWRPPGDLVMELVRAHFDIEPDHDPLDLQLEMVAWCDRRELEMAHNRSETIAGGQRHHYDCPRCHRSAAVFQNADGVQ